MPCCTNMVLNFTFQRQKQFFSSNFSTAYFIEIAIETNFKKQKLTQQIVEKQRNSAKKIVIISTDNVETLLSTIIEMKIAKKQTTQKNTSSDNQRQRGKKQSYLSTLRRGQNRSRKEQPYQKHLGEHPVEAWSPEDRAKNLAKIYTLQSPKKLRRS